MNVQEQAIQITGDGFEMLGILSLPAPGTPTLRTSMLIVVGGAQYRAGSHRQFVLLARRLAAAGYPVMRFDLPGMGDSPGDAVSFEDTAPHIAAAIAAMARTTPVARSVLWGLCDGASASLLYLQATHDPRVAGLALLNPWVRSEAGLARTQVKHYYRQRLLQADFWRKLIRGGVGWPAMRGLWSNLRAMRQTAPRSLSFQELMALSWQAFEGKIMLILSRQDLTTQEFIEYATLHPQWRHALQRPSVNATTLRTQTTPARSLGSRKSWSG